MGLLSVFSKRYQEKLSFSSVFACVSLKQKSKVFQSFLCLFGGVAPTGLLYST